jgi:hypothetical protein
MGRTVRYLVLAVGTPLLALTYTAKDAHAFDTVEWRWDASVTETVTSIVAINIDLTPAGMLFLENNQVYIGNIAAVSEVDGVHNNAFDDVTTETIFQDVSEMAFVDVDFEAHLQIGAGNNDGANPQGAAKYGTNGSFTNPLLAGAQSHIALFTLLQNNPDSIDYEKSFVNETTSDFEVYAYFADLDLYLEVKGSYADCTPGGANCTPTGDVELYRLNGDQKEFSALGTLSQQNGVDKINTTGPGGEVKLSADFDGAQEWQEIFSQFATQQVSIIPTTKDALTDFPSVVSTATAVANNSSIDSDVAIQLDSSQLAWGGFNTEETPEQTLISAFLGDQLGSMVSGDVTALSSVSDILNASVNSAATAVVNNQQIGIAATDPADGLVIADVTQFSYNRVVATSTVANVTLNSYLNLGLVDDPQIASNATAVGNNMAIIVNTRF